MRALALRLTALLGVAVLTPAFGQTQDQLDDAARSREWLMSNHDYAGRRYVDIDRIDNDTAALVPLCTFETGSTEPFYTAPVVHRDLMYVTTTWETIAIDAASCAERWRHRWALKGRQVWVTNRGVALAAGRVLRGTTDGYLLAIDGATGELLWERAVADSDQGETLTMAPLVFEDRVVIGAAGSENAIRGWIGALRLSDGQPMWRFFTVPQPGELGAETWGGSPERKVGGGGVWTPLSLDVETATLFVPVGNPAPDFFGAARPGDNLYTNSLVALDVRSGALRWHYQAVPHDLHDWDLTQVSPLFSTTVEGKRRPLVAVVGKDGVLRVLDRSTREVVYRVAVSRQENVGRALTTEGVHACPGVLGGVQWNGPAFSPRLNALFVPSVDWCGTFSRAPDTDFVPGYPYIGGRYRPDPLEDAAGWLTAVDAASGAIRWRYRSERPMTAGVVATSGDVVITGELTGHLLVLDARDGTVRLRRDLGAPVAGGVISYEQAGRQLVAVTTGAMTGFWQTAQHPARITILGAGAP